MANMPTQVDLEGMKRAQVTFEEAVENCATSYASVEGQVEALHASWNGESANIYSHGMEQWLISFKKLVDALQAMLQRLSETTGQQANTHEDTMAEAAKVQNMSHLGGLQGFPI